MTIPARHTLTFLLLAASVLQCVPASGTEFLRITSDDENGPLALQAAIATYRPINGRGAMISVDLVAALHVAEPSYYAELNRRFASYDSVLYELIASQGTSVPVGGLENPGQGQGLVFQGTAHTDSS